MVFSDLSLKLTKEIDSNIKKNEGIFFTPPEIVSHMIDYIKCHVKCDPKILEPSFGSGEILTKLIDTFPKSTITGVEKNKEIYDTVVNGLSTDKRVNYINSDFLEYKSNDYDLIVGNPPYFVLEKGIYEEYDCYFSGRPNILHTYTRQQHINKYSRYSDW